MRELPVSQVRFNRARTWSIRGGIEHLVCDDHSTYQCNKTVHDTRTGGEWDADGNYLASGHESMCAGAMIYLERIGHPTVGMRVGRVFGLYDSEHLMPAFGEIIDPKADEENV